MKKRTLSDEESNLWAAVTSSIRPLQQKENGRPLPLPASGEDNFPLPKFFLKAEKSKPTSHLSVSTLISRDTKNIRLQGRLDLHGLTVERAKISLETFFLRNQDQGNKWALVITGKGGHANGGRGILKDFVPQWLGQHPLLIVGYSCAEKKDGGDGALYVRIRKKRQ
ncbi:MAG: Smr/MutS family protein [Alphaproteobacteria bacterium]|nr:Smr/MutS family protein [Alphaproteobacteria bacterium]